MASRVRPALSDNELIDIFMGILQGFYYERMVGSSYSNFIDIVTIGERIENRLKSGKITGNATQQTVSKKSRGGFSKKKEWEASVITVNVYPQFQAAMDPMLFCPYPYIAAAQYQDQTFQYQSLNQVQKPSQAQYPQYFSYPNFVIPFISFSPIQSCMSHCII